MSRIGKKPIAIPSGVTVEVQAGMLSVQGPKGRLSRPLPSVVSVVVENGEALLAVSHPEEKTERSLWGTFGSHLTNMVEGVTNGFTKSLEINGVGYRVALQGKDLKLEVGYSHPVVYAMPEGVTASVEKNVITLTGCDKEMVGQAAAEIRAIRKPEPYKGKGIKYSDETVRRKAGKAAKAGE